MWRKYSMPTSVYKSIILFLELKFPLVTSVVLLTGKPPYWHDLPWRAKRSLSYGAHSWAPCGYCNENDARRWVEELFTTLKNFLVFLFIYLFIYRGYYTVARRYEFYFRVAKYCFCHEKIKFISSSRLVMFFLLYRQKDIDKIKDFYSPKSNCDGSDLQHSNKRHWLQ